MMSWLRRLLTRPLRDNEIVMPNGQLGHVVENSDHKLIVRVDDPPHAHYRSATFYNLDKRTGEKNIRHLSTTL